MRRKIGTASTNEGQASFWDEIDFKLQKKKKKESREDGNSFFASLLAFEKQFLGEFDLGMEIEKEEWTS